MNLSIAIIAKNEESCLRECLESVKEADEIVVCDTGSEDKTTEIAKKYTDKVFDDYKWDDSFCEARNHAIFKCTGDWVLNIDADNRLLTPIKEVKNIIKQAEAKGARSISVKCISDRNGNVHYLPNLHKRSSDIFWVGNIHNYLNIPSDVVGDISVGYGYSKAHEKDPDRALRILLKEVEKGGKTRELYYLAREYWYRKDYNKAISWWEKYIKVSNFLSEKADAYLYLARCYWALRQGEKARQNCIQALNINANFKEALLFMATLSWEHNAKSWRKYAELATNENVLFIRNG